MGRTEVLAGTHLFPEERVKLSNKFGTKPVSAICKGPFYIITENCIILGMTQEISRLVQICHLYFTISEEGFKYYHIRMRRIVKHHQSFYFIFL